MEVLKNTMSWLMLGIGIPVEISACILASLAHTVLTYLKVHGSGDIT